MTTTNTTETPFVSAHPYASLPTPQPQAAPIDHFRDEHRFLSNFWFVPGGISLGNLTGATVEHIFQASKTVDPTQRREILDASSPGKAKRLGAKVQLRSDWEQIKLGTMARLQAAKYAQPEMARLLDGTGDADLIEGNHWCDTFWGVCTCQAHATEGRNWLGQILMIQRSVLRG